MTNKSLVDCDLSVVVIARNEEDMIATCIESVLTSVKNAHDAGIIGSSELILADSASTDRTIEIAKRYPIKIVQLDQKWPLSASAGRYIGFLNSIGRYVYFMDGDCTMDEQWFSKSIPYLKDERIGGLEGIEAEYVSSNSLLQTMVESSSSKTETVIETDFVGKALFKREVLEEVGPYNPYLIGGEDRDISYRVCSAGYLLLRLPFNAVTHFWAKKEGNLSLKRYLQSVYVWSKGDGQAFRYTYKDSDMFYRHILRYVNTFYLKVYGLIFLLVSFTYMNILAFILSSESIASFLIAVFIDLILMGFAGLYMVIRKKGGQWKEFLFSFHMIPYVLVRHYGFIVGFLKFPKDPKNYPTNAMLIKD
ncbi:glycosyltransferase [Methanolobus sp. WCC4]|uniref:glycosyltransferase n=1 Tax=Methanolobus sp. WCC4 TaxID=3125784 RepID=UPI0030FADF72